VHPLAERNAREYLAIADGLFGSRVVGFYVVGSAAYGEFKPNRSDVDFVAVLDEHVAGDCRVMRKAQLRSMARVGIRALARGHVQGVGGCNGVYVTEADLRRPVTEIEPVGSHSGHLHHCGKAFDVNPVQWTTFARHGIALRGPAPSDLGLDPQPELLRQWNLDNLNAYWKAESERTASGKPYQRLRPFGARWITAWVVLGPARMHHTVATGSIVSKEHAGEYALDTFGSEWHPIIGEALAYVRGEPAAAAFKDKQHRYRTTGEFGLHVIEAANAIP
jgi:hypothetical protein